MYFAWNLALAVGKWHIFVANVDSVYAAFLKRLKKSALKTMEFRGAEFELNKNIHEVHNCDANKLAGHIKGDILYLYPAL